VPRPDWVNLMNGELKIEIVWGGLGLEFGFGSSLDMRLVFGLLLQVVVLVVEAAEGRIDVVGDRSGTWAGRNWCRGGREVTEEADVATLPSISEMAPGVVALAEQ